MEPEEEILQSYDPNHISFLLEAYPHLKYQEPVNEQILIHLIKNTTIHIVDLINDGWQFISYSNYGPEGTMRDIVSSYKLALSDTANHFRLQEMYLAYVQFGLPTETLVVVATRMLKNEISEAKHSRHIYELMDLIFLREPTVDIGVVNIWFKKLLDTVLSICAMANLDSIPIPDKGSDMLESYYRLSRQLLLKIHPSDALSGKLLSKLVNIIDYLHSDFYKRNIGEHDINIKQLVDLVIPHVTYQSRLTFDKFIKLICDKCLVSRQLMLSKLKTLLEPFLANEKLGKALLDNTYTYSYSQEEPQVTHTFRYPTYIHVYCKTLKKLPSSHEEIERWRIRSSVIGKVTNILLVSHKRGDKNSNDITIDSYVNHNIILQLLQHHLSLTIPPNNISQSIIYQLAHFILQTIHQEK